MIRFNGVGKTYTAPLGNRRVDALRDFTLEVQRGEVIGIAGPNGAGKSTLISLLLGFLNPTHGSVSIDGHSPRQFVERNGISYLPEFVNLPPRWKVAPVLKRMAALSGVPAGARDARTGQSIDSLGLDEHRAKTIKQLSKGNLQRVGLAQALIGEFDIVVLDEPTHGLDPVWTQRFRDIVQQLRRPERVIFIASHNLDELERLADRVAILNKGQLQRVVEHGVSTTSVAPVMWRLVFESLPASIADVLAGGAPIAGRPGTWRVAATRTQLSASLARLLSEGAILIECVPEESRLESEFRAAVES